MKKRLTARIAAAVAIVATILIASIMVLAFSIADLRDSSEAASRSERTLGVANQVGSLVIDAETGVRGYAITSQDAFLTPLDSARRQLPLAARSLNAAHFATTNEKVLAQSMTTEALSYVSDYATPLVKTIRTNPSAGRSVIVSGAGKRRVDSIRGELADLTTAIQQEADARDAAASSHASRAMTIALAAGLLAAVLFGLLIYYLARSVAAPIRRAADAAGRLGRGDLTTRLAERRSDEIGSLSVAFNVMGEALLESHSELENQHAELEAQNAELERQAVELESQAVELETQAGELEVGQLELGDTNRALTERSEALEEASAALREAHQRVALFAGVAEELGRRTELQERADTLLRSVSEMTGSAVGVIFTAPGHETDSMQPVSVRGLDPAGLPAQLTTADGLAGRALAEGRPVQAEHAPGDLRLQSFGAAVTIRHELHVPLIHGDHHTGVLSIGRTHDRPYGVDEVAAIEHLAEQGAVALANSIEVERNQWLGDLNRAVLDAAGDAIHMVGLDREVLLSNPAMDVFMREVLFNNVDATGWSSEEVSTFIATRTTDPDGYRERIANLWGDPTLETVDEFAFKDTNRWVRRYTAPVRTRSGQLIGRIFVFTETTDVREAERVKDELMATVSHELRTPLAAILGFTELLMAREYDLDERQEYLGTVHQQASRLSDLISDFLDLQRLEHSDEGVSLQPVDLLDILKQQVQLFSGQSERHALQLKAAQQEQLQVVGDADRLRRAFANLLSNAIKYSPDGGDVTVEATRHNGHVTVAVSDHGVGIPPDSQDRIFDRFFRVDSSETRRIGGTGLGLALVREIMKVHEGEVGFESVEGQGSRFWIKVPALHDVAGTGGAPLPARRERA